ARTRAAVAVPLFTLSGPDGLALGLNDCTPRLLLVQADAERWQGLFPALRVITADGDLERRLRRESPRYTPVTRADDPAVLQYTSGTTRALAETVRHAHRSVLT